MASLRTLDARWYPVAQAFVDVLKQFGYSVTVTSARRDPAKQQQLWDAYISGRSKYPAAPPGRSPHELGIGFDLHLDPPDYRVPGLVWEALGLRWGGRFNDPIHFDFWPKGYVPPPRPVSAAEKRAKARLPRH